MFAQREGEAIHGRSMDKRLIYIALNAVPGMTPASFWKAIRRLTEPGRIFSLPETELRSLGFSRELARRIQEGDPEKRAEQEQEKVLQRGGEILVLGDSKYPPLLTTIPDPPPALYVLGEIRQEDRIALAIVGSRSATTKGRLNAEKMASKLAGMGMTIVSGLAMGVDTWAHQGALKVDGRTLAVLGCGLDYPYPRFNRELKKKIIEKGALISEFPMGTPPVPFNFPRRNRIISGLSLGTLVVEATKRSGSLITAELALEQGREVFAIPGNIGSSQSEGCNVLIQKGAKLVQGVADILEEFPQEVRAYLSVAKKESNREKGVKNREERTLLGLIQEEPVHIDVLTEETSFSSAMISSLLMKMEIKGLVRQLPGKFFTRI
jgi:DNA processing protein